MNKTTIEWARNPDGTQGYTWNVITGCLNDCSYCYARKLANGRLKPLYLANRNWAGDKLLTDLDLFRANDPFYPRFWEERLEQPAIGNRFKGIFVCDMSDLFGQGIPDEWTKQVLDEIRLNPYCRFYLLTKQPQNLIKFSFPENAWVGVTATNGESYQLATLWLAQIKAAVKYVSFEPLLGKMQFFDKRITEVDWLIIGACTGSYLEMMKLCCRTAIPVCNVMPYGNKWTAQPRIEWVREIVQAADKAGVKVFLKDNLEPLIRWPQDGPWAFKEASNMLRQEMPEC